MIKIQTLDNISSQGLDRLHRDHYEVSSEPCDPSAILLRSSKIHDMNFLPELKVIARAGVGVDNVPIDRCTDSGIVVFNTPGANANAVSELVISAMLLSNRKLVSGMDFCQNLKGADGDIAKLAEKGKKQFGGQELLGKTLGLIGLGAIGGRVAQVAEGLGMKVIGYDPWLSVDHALKLPKGIVITDYIQELYSQCDYISIHVPLFEKTKNFINADVLSQCKKGVKLFNFSRDGIVENQAVIQSVDKKHLAHYSTDFTQPELLDHEHIACFPHLGASTPEAEENCAVMACEQTKDFLENGNVNNSVNFPVVSMPRTSPHRLTIFTRNIPNMLGQISSTLGDRSLNIAEFVNKSRGDVAYNIIDLDHECDESILKALHSLEGVIAARVMPQL